MIIVYYGNKNLLRLCKYATTWGIAVSVSYETEKLMSLVKKSLNKTRDCSDKPRPSIGREEGCRYFPIDTKL